MSNTKVGIVPAKPQQPAPSDKGSEPFELMDKMDEEQVLAELKGQSLDVLVYSFVQDGKSVTGLSLAGVRETARQLNLSGQAKIAVSSKPPIVIETGEDDSSGYIEVQVYAVDRQNGGGYWGVKRQAKGMNTSRGWKRNPFAYEQAVSKAQRNAMRGLIPEQFVVQMIDAFKKRGAVKPVNPPAQPPKQVEEGQTREAPEQKQDATQSQSAVATTMPTQTVNSNETLLAYVNAMGRNFKNVGEMRNELVRLGVRSTPSANAASAWEELANILTVDK